MNKSVKMNYYNDKFNTPVKKMLVAGIGNIARMDDAVGPHIISYIRESGFILPDYVEILEIDGAVYDLVPVMMGRNRVVIVDALKTDDIPGSVYKVPSNELRKNYWMLLGNSPELREIIFQCFIKSGEIDIDFIGIVPEQVDKCNMHLSESVKSKIPFAAAEVMKIINQQSKI